MRLSGGFEAWRALPWKEIPAHGELIGTKSSCSVAALIHLLKPGDKPYLLSHSCSLATIALEISQRNSPLGKMIVARKSMWSMDEQM